LDKPLLDVDRLETAMGGGRFLENTRGGMNLREQIITFHNGQKRKFFNYWEVARNIRYYKLL
jgi:hypothetical protein